MPLSAPPIYKCKTLEVQIVPQWPLVNKLYENCFLELVFRTTKLNWLQTKPNAIWFGFESQKLKSFVFGLVWVSEN